jgi:hypothetical protein
MNVSDDDERVLGVNTNSHDKDEDPTISEDEIMKTTVNGPPPGAPGGGQWGTGVVFGPQTALIAGLIFVLFGLIFLLGGFICSGIFLGYAVYGNGKRDRMALYFVDGEYYNTQGDLVKLRRDSDFQPNPEGTTAGPPPIPQHFLEKKCGRHYMYFILGCSLFLALVIIVVEVTAIVLLVEDSDELSVCHDGKSPFWVVSGYMQCRVVE